jgi:hypothetical protein
MKRLATVLVVLLVVLAGCNAPANSGTTTDDATEATTVPETTTTAPTTTSDDTDETDDTDDALADPESDVLGWENGYWYNESITVDRSDGLNDSELDAVVARGMARVEHVRELEFNETVPVEIVSREEFASNSGNRTYSTADRLHQNTKWEAMLMVGEDTDSLAVQQQNRASSVGGYYSPSEERIVIVSENTTSPKMDEITLAQELFHALQDQQFDLSVDYSTQESHNANDGIVEGDGNYVDYLYEQECEDGSWGDCLMPQASGGGGGSADIHFGLYFVTFQPYSDGPNFVKQIHEQQGWDAVNAVYENPPASTEQTIHPDKYGSDAPTDVEFTDTSNDEWNVLDMGPNSIDYATYGEAGFASMFYYATFSASREAGARTNVVIPYRDFFNTNANGETDPTNPYNYNFSPSAGWDGDKLYPYVNASSADTNETAFVWKTVWDSDADADEFASAYVELLEHYGGEPVDDRANTYVIPSGNEFEDAFYVHVDGDTVYLVNAPSVDDLDDVFDDTETSN